MKNLRLISMLLVVLIFCSCQDGKSQNQESVKVTSQQSHAHKNLAVYLIRGKDVVNRKYITLEEAMDNKYIVLHETGNVGELSVDNKSDKYVFILSGDIVKGGRQDRTIAEDIILKPGCRKVPLKSFCVEQSRWTQRGMENVAAFSSSKNMLSNKNLKIAAREQKQQHAVWTEVSSFQDKASVNVKSNVKSRESATSLQLTLENKDLQSSVKEYVKAMESLFAGKNDVIGFAFCINGKISTIDVFGNADLFSKLRSKLLESAANEAVCMYDEKLKFDNPSADEVNAFITSAVEFAQKGDVTVTETGKNTLEKKYKTSKCIMFRTYNTDAGEYPIHTSMFSTEDMKITDHPKVQINSFPQSSGFRYGGINRNRN